MRSLTAVVLAGVALGMVIGMMCVLSPTDPILLRKLYRPSEDLLRVMYIQELCYNAARDGLTDIPVKAVPKIVDQLRQLNGYTAVEVGVGEFCDKPAAPFGQEQIDTCFVLHQRMTDWKLLEGMVFRDATEQFTLMSGLDSASNQLDAIISAFHTAGFVLPTEMRVGKETRLFLVFTANPFHVEGDFKEGLRYPEGGLGSMESEECVRHDYPSLTTLAKLARRENIHVAIILTRPRLEDDYAGLVKVFETHNSPQPFVITATTEEQMIAIAEKISKKLVAY